MIESPAMQTFRAVLEAMCRAQNVEIYIDPTGVLEVWRRPPGEMNSPIQCRIVDCIGLAKEVRPQEKPPAIPELTELKRVTAKQGDVIVVMSNGFFTSGAEARIKDILKVAFPNNDSLILGPGIRIGVVGKSE